MNRDTLVELEANATVVVDLCHDAQKNPELPLLTEPPGSVILLTDESINDPADQKERRREQLLDAALELFARQGVERTTVSNIAEAAGVSHGLLYHYFKSKEEMLHSIVERVSFLPEIKALFEGSHQRPASEFLPHYVEEFQRLLEERREAIWLLFVEGRRDPKLGAELEKLGELIRQPLVDYLKARVETGELGRHRVEDMARSLSSVIFMEHLWPEPERPLAQAALQFLLHGVDKDR